LFYMEKVLVSQCLLGELCRWDGKLITDKALRRQINDEIWPICPEMASGLPCPRPKAEIINGNGFDVLDGKARVLNSDGADVTDSFLRGAQAALKKAVKNGITKAILKDKSPSCGVEFIYIDGKLISGCGVTTALLIRHGMEVIPL
jgi:uncharacterized protein YbbK (DUF523 family)